MKKTNKICIAVTYAGTLHFYLGLTEILRRNNWEVTFLSGDKARLAEYCSYCDRAVYQKYLVRKPKLAYDFLCFFSLFFFFLKNRFDVVYVATPKAGLIGSVAAFLAGQRVLYSIIGRAYEVFEGKKRRFYVLLDKIACFCARRIVTISPSLRDAVLKDGCCSPKKICCANLRPCFVDKSQLFVNSDKVEQAGKKLRKEWNISEDSTVILFVGRICKDKGIAELVAAFQKISQENVYLVLVGRDDDQKRELGEDVWSFIKSGKNVVFAGHVSFQEIPQYYSACDIFACPTYREARSAVGGEASLMEKPVVLTDAVGARDTLIDGETGIMVPTKQVDPLAQALKRLIDDPPLREKMGKRGRLFALENLRRPTDKEILGFFESFLAKDSKSKSKDSKSE